VARWEFPPISVINIPPTCWRETDIRQKISFQINLSVQLLFFGAFSAGADSE